MKIRNFQMRRAAILLAVLASLMITLSLVLLSVQSSLQSRRECKAIHLLRQTNLLVEAGRLRAIERLKQSDEYEGELWEPAISILGESIASVQINVDHRDSMKSSSQRTVAIKAHIETSVRSLSSFQRTFQFTLHRTRHQAETDTCQD